METLGWIFSDGKKPEPQEKWPVSSEPYMLLTTDEQWENYSDAEAYDFEVRLRAFLEYMQGKTTYNTAMRRRFSYKQIYQRLYGTETSGKNHQDTTNRAICAWYSSRILGDTEVRGKRVKQCFVLAPSRLSKPPWCIKLRLEWYMERGEAVNAAMLRVHHKQLKSGQARNPRVQANMDKRKEKARAAYNAKYNTREYRDSLNKDVQPGEQ